MGVPSFSANPFQPDLAYLNDTTSSAFAQLLFELFTESRRIHARRQEGRNANEGKEALLVPVPTPQTQAGMRPSKTSFAISKSHYGRAHRSHRWGAGAERAQWAKQRGGGVLSKGASQAAARRGDHCEVDRAQRDHRFESCCDHQVPQAERPGDSFCLGDSKNRPLCHRWICCLCLQMPPAGVAHFCCRNKDRCGIMMMLV